MLRDAIAEIAEEQERQRKRDAKAQKGRRGLLRWLDARVLIGLAVAIVVLIADGVRRENAEFYVTVANIVGSVTITGPDGATIAPRPRTRLATGSTVTTGRDAKLVLETRDGSRILVSPETEFVVNGLDYNRGANYRDHSFALRRGKAMASVSQRFGADSELTMGTPGAVAAVRGTIFMVTYDARAKVAFAACHDGRVDFTSNGAVVSTIGAGYYAGARPDGTVTMPQPVPEDVTREFLGAGELYIPPSKDPLMQRVEYGLNRFLDPVLQILGVGKCSWSVLAGNAARRTTAMRAGQDIRQALESMEELPKTINLQTLEGLGLPEDRRRVVLKQLAGNALEVYLADGRDYVILLRAKDRAKTRFMVTRDGVQNVQGRETTVERQLARFRGALSGAIMRPPAEMGLD